MKGRLRVLPGWPAMALRPFSFFLTQPGFHALSSCSLGLARLCSDGTERGPWALPSIGPAAAQGLSPCPARDKWAGRAGLRVPGTKSRVHGLWPHAWELPSVPRTLTGPWVPGDLARSAHSQGPLSSAGRTPPRRSEPFPAPPEDGELGEPSFLRSLMPPVPHLLSL